MLRFINLLILQILLIPIKAQELTTKSFTELTNDITARSNPRNDLNGNPCALVKVRMAVDNATFKGMVVGDVRHEGSEYYVYLPEGAKKVTISAPNYLPLDIIFEDYGITSLASKTTYVLTIITPDKHIISSRKELIFHIAPSDASLYVDGLEEDVINGTAKVRLSNGLHEYKVSSKYYIMQEGEFSVSDDRNNDPINVTLVRKKGTLNIATTAGADVYLNAKYIGKSPVYNYSVDAGIYNIRITKKGYNTINETIEVESDKINNYNRTLLAIANIQIQTFPQYADLYIDGVKINGSSPYTISKTIGKHKLESSAQGYKNLHKTLVVNGNKNSYTYKLKKEFFAKHGGYFEANMNSFQRFTIGGAIGFYLWDINFELDAEFSLDSYRYLDFESYKPFIAGCKTGYALHLGNRVLLTPQVGIEYVEIESKYSKTSIYDAVFGLRISIAILKHLGLSITPEYYLPINKKDILKYSSKTEGWTNGFCCKFGINFYGR